MKSKKEEKKREGFKAATIIEKTATIEEIVRFLFKKIFMAEKLLTYKIFRF